MIVAKKEDNEYIAEFTVLETDFTDSQNAHILYKLKSDNYSPPEDIEVNQAKSLKVTDLYNDAIVFIFNDPDKNDDLCDPFIVNLKHFAVNETSEINAETYCNDEKTGNIKIKLEIKEILSNNVKMKQFEVKIKNLKKMLKN